MHGKSRGYDRGWQVNQPLPGLADIGHALKGKRPKFAPIVETTGRCAYCGTRWSHWWGKHDGHSVCGHCAGMPVPERRKG